MKSFLSSILCIFILRDANLCNCDCITEEFTSRRFYVSYYNFTRGPLIWTANSTILSTCFQVDSCFNALGITTNNLTNYILFIKIDNVTIANYQNVQIKYEIENSPTIICQAMQIYAKPRNVTCKAVATYDHLYITCLATQVSTPILCNFFTTSIPYRDWQNGTYQQLNVQPGSVYFDYECTSSYRLSSLRPGKLSFTTFIDCNVSNSMQNCMDADIDTQLTLPEVDTLGSCPNGTDVVGNFVLAGSPATCTCYLTSSGHPPGYPTFESSTNGPLNVTTSDNRATLHLIYDNRSQSHEYNCSGYSALKPPYHVKPFQVEFAYGPSSVSISTEPITNIVNLCPGGIPALNVTCVVPIDTTYPAPHLHLNINNTNKSVASGYQLQFKHEFNESGIYELRCYAENSKFKKLNTDSIIIFTVQEPPKTAPVLKVNDTLQYSGLTGNSVNVSTDDSATVTCHGLGGFPPANSTNITCNDSTVQVEVDGQVKVRLSKDGQVVTCNCTAYHASGCYSNNTTSLRFKAFAPVTEESNNEMLIIGLALGLPLAGLLLICVTLICIIKRRRPPGQHTPVHRRPPGYDDLTTVRLPEENARYNPVVIQDGAPIANVVDSSYCEITLGDDVNEIISKKPRVARPDSKERVFVEQIGSETRITLENYNGRLKFVRSKITKRSKYLPQAKSQASAVNQEAKAGMHRKRSGNKKRSLKQKTRAGAYVNTDELGARSNISKIKETDVTDGNIDYREENLRRVETKNRDKDSKGVFTISQTDPNEKEGDRQQAGKQRYENVYKGM